MDYKTTLHSLQTHDVNMNFCIERGYILTNDVINSQEHKLCQINVQGLNSKFKENRGTKIIISSG